MKSAVLILLTVFQFFAFSFANTEVYSNLKGDKFGLKSSDEPDKIITEAKYKKLIKLGENGYLFMYKNKYGIISDNGEVLIEPKYTHAQRFVGKFANLGKNNKYGIFDGSGDVIIEPEYDSIKLLYGEMFLVYKKYKYGLISFDGDILMAPVADDIYMPKSNAIKIKYDGTWYEITQEKEGDLDLWQNITMADIMDDNLTVEKIVKNPVTSAGYGIVSTSDYMIKLFSSLSPAYEETIDELVLNNGADAVSILMKCSWLAKFPFVYTRNYINTFKTPNNGPLSEVKIILKNKINDKSSKI